MPTQAPSLVNKPSEASALQPHRCRWHSCPCCIALGPCCLKEIMPQSRVSCWIIGEHIQGVALRIDPKFDLLGLFCFSEILCYCGFLKEKDPKIDSKLGQRVSKLRPAWNLNQNMPNLRATSEQIQGKKEPSLKLDFENLIGTAEIRWF